MAKSSSAGQVSEASTKAEKLRVPKELVDVWRDFSRDLKCRTRVVSYRQLEGKKHLVIAISESKKKALEPLIQHLRFHPEGIVIHRADAGGFIRTNLGNHLLELFHPSALQLIVTHTHCLHVRLIR